MDRARWIDPLMNSNFRGIVMTRTWTRLILLATCFELGACALPESKSFGEDDDLASGGGHAAAGAQNGSAAAGQTDVGAGGTDGSPIVAGSGGASAGGTTGTPLSGGSAGTAGNLETGGLGGSAGTQQVGGSGGSITGGAGGAGGAGGESCSYAYCYTLQEGLDFAAICPLQLSEVEPLECGDRARGECAGRDTVRTHIGYAMGIGGYEDCYFRDGELVGMANVTDHGTWVAGEVSVEPNSCTALVFDDLQFCGGGEVSSPDGIVCPLRLPEVGASCGESGRCDYSSTINCSDTCSSEITHRLRCLGGTWEDWGITDGSCMDCDTVHSDSCPESLPGGACYQNGIVCTYSFALECPEGCSGGSLNQVACVDREWFDIMHTAGAPVCYCP